MPKCRKRRICREPDYVIFQSENGLDDVTTLTVDEYEAIRQIDMEGLSQEECAKKMCVARTTAQLIYNSARKKIAESIVLGKSIRIEGGNYILCDGSPCCENCCKSTQPVNYMQKKGENVMRIAVTYENGEVFQHFGRTENFKIYEVENNKIVNSQVMGSNGIGHGALAGLLSGNQIDVLICSGSSRKCRHYLMFRCIRRHRQSSRSLSAWRADLCRCYMQPSQSRRRTRLWKSRLWSPLIINIQEYL